MLAVLERKFIKNMHGPKENEQTDRYEIKLNAELKNFLESERENNEDELVGSQNH